MTRQTTCDQCGLVVELGQSLFVMTGSTRSHELEGKDFCSVNCLRDYLNATH